MHEKWEKRSLPSEENLEKAWRNLEDQDWSEMRLFGRENERAIEREIKRNEGWIAWRSLNRPSINLDRWRCRDICWGRYREKWSSTDTGIEEVSRNKPSDTRTEARLIHQLSRSYRGGRNFLDHSTRCRETVEIANKKKLKKLDR